MENINPAIINNSFKYIVLSTLLLLGSVACFILLMANVLDNKWYIYLLISLMAICSIGCYYKANRLLQIERQ